MPTGTFQLVGVLAFCALDVHEYIEEKERGSCLFQTQIYGCERVVNCFVLS